MHDLWIIAVHYILLRRLHLSTGACEFTNGQNGEILSFYLSNTRNVLLQNILLKIH